MNIELRTDVLAKSLILEDALSRLLAILFRFSKNTSKTLGHTSSSLSFKTKADLLYDLGRLKDEQHKALIMFMEIRNQLIHNLDCDSLMKAVLRCNKTNKFLAIDEKLKKQFHDTTNENQKETILKLLLEQLTKNIISFCKSIIGSIEEEIKEEDRRRKKEFEAEFLLGAIKCLSDSVDMVSDISDEVFIGDDQENKKFKGQYKKLIWLGFMKGLKINFPDIVDEVLKDMKNAKD